MVGERKHRGRVKKRAGEKGNEMEREKERKIETEMKSASEKRARMHAAARWRAGWRIRRGPSVPREGGYVPRRKERLRKRNSDARRAEDAPIYEPGMKTRGGTSAREYGTQGGRGRASERGGNGDEKERRYARKERRNDIERERARGVARERRRASA